MKAQTMGASTDCTLIVTIGDGLAGDVDVARWANVGPSYGEAPATALAAIVPSPADIAMVNAWGGLAYLASSSVPMVAANLVLREGESFLAPYRVVECAGQRVVFVGLAEPGEWSDELSTAPLEAAYLQIQEATRKAPSVILLSNAGLTADRQIAAIIPGIDLIVGGGQDPLDAPQTVGDTLVVRTGPAGRSVGVLWLTFDSTGRLTQHVWEQVTYMPQW